MNLFKNLDALKSLVKEVLVICLFVGGLAAAWFIYGRVWTHFTQISEEEAQAVCQDLYDEVEARISAAKDYEILGGHKGCWPHKNAEGGTFYTARSVFRVTKAGNDTTEEIKANISNLADQYSRGEKFSAENKGYTIWVNNDEGIDGQPDSICLKASMMIFSNGAPYDSSLTKYPSYIEPVSPPEHRAPCSEV